MAKKRKSHQEPAPQGKYHIGIQNPIELRRDILEPTREMVQFLQSYEQFKIVMEQKKELLVQLRQQVKGIKSQVYQLRALLPRTKTEAESTYAKIKKEMQEEQRIVKPKVVARPAAKPQPAVQDLQSLERELSEIESKLETLG